MLDTNQILFLIKLSFSLQNSWTYLQQLNPLIIPDKQIKLNSMRLKSMQPILRLPSPH